MISAQTLCVCRDGKPLYTFPDRAPSFLALRAPESRAAVLGEAADNAAAAGSSTCFAFPVVDLKRMLEVAKLAVGLAVIAQRGAAGLDRLVEHRADRLDQMPGVLGRLASGDALALPRPGRKRCCQSPRRQTRAVERLAHIDIAEPRNYALIEQRRLQAGLPVGTGLRQHLGVERIAERFGAEPPQQRLVIERLAGDDLHIAETPGVVENHIRARRHVTHHMVMRGVLAALM